MLDTIAMAAQLKGEYKTVFEKADMYGTLDNSCDANIKDDKMMNLYDLLMQAQNDNIPVSKIIGDDIETFCKSYFEEEKEKTYKWIGAAKAVYRIAWWVTIAGILEFWAWEKSSFEFFPEIDVMPFVIGSLFGLLLFFFIWFAKKNVLKSKKLKPIVFYLLILFVVVIVIVLSGITSIQMGIEWKVNGGFLVVFSGVYIAIYLIIRSVWRYRDHGTITRYSKKEKSILKKENEEKKEFNRAVSKRNVSQTVKDMKFRYKRFSRRHEKKYGMPMSLQQYKEKLMKELKIYDWDWLFYLIMLVIFVIAPTIQVVIEDGLKEALIYGIVQSIIYVFIYRFIKWTSNITKDSYAEMFYVLDLCIEHDFDLDTVGEAVESGVIETDI